MPPRPVTLRDIARAAKVSVATVSLALRHDPRITPTVRDEIQILAANMGYKVNPLISTLMSHLRGGETSSEQDVIAFLSSHPNEKEWRAHYPQAALYDSCCLRAEALGYRMELIHYVALGWSEKRLLQVLRNRGIKGVIVGPYPVGQIGHLKENWDDFALATIGYTLASPALHRITSDHYHNTLRGIAELRRLGYHRIGCVVQSSIARRVEMSWPAAVQASWLENPRLARIPPLILETSEWTAPNIIDWYRQHQPDVLLCYDDTPYYWLQTALGPQSTPPWCCLSLRNGQHPHFGIEESIHAVGTSTINIVTRQLAQNDLGIPASPALILLPGHWRGPVAQPGGETRPSFFLPTNHA